MRKIRKIKDSTHDEKHQNESILRVDVSWKDFLLLLPFSVILNILIAIYALDNFYSIFSFFWFSEGICIIIIYIIKGLSRMKGMYEENMPIPWWKEMNIARCFYIFVSGSALLLGGLGTFGRFRGAIERFASSSIVDFVVVGLIFLGCILSVHIYFVVIFRLLRSLKIR